MMVVGFDDKNDDDDGRRVIAGQGSTALSPTLTSLIAHDWLRPSLLLK